MVVGQKSFSISFSDNVENNLLDDVTLQCHGLREFSDHDQNKVSPLNSLPLSRVVVSFGRGLPSLSKKLVDQIKANQYVDFADLPPARGKVRTSQQPTSMEGHIVLVQAADLMDTKKIIPDLSVWLQCFALYVAALAPPPDRLQDLMAYQSFIAKCSLKYRWPSWVVYDQNFRMEVANQPDRLWAQSDPSIYAQSFTNQAFLTENWCTECQSLDHSWAACPRRPRKRPPPSASPCTYNKSKKTCDLYNKYNGDCRYGKDCYFRHVCSICAGPHPQSVCRDKK